MTGFPKISIITICYNAEETIKTTLQSVATQTYSNIEYVIIDGASTDNTLQLVSEYTPFAQVYSEPDKGLYDAMNKGIDRATGEYLWFLNAGDTFRAPDIVERISEQISLFSTHNSDSTPGIVYGDTMIVDGLGTDLHLRRLRPPSVLTAQSFQEGMLVCHQAFIVRRDYAVKYDLQYRFSADFDWCIRILKKGAIPLNLGFILVNYLSEGLTTQNHRASLCERFRIMAKHYGLWIAVRQHLKFLFIRKR